MRLYIDEDSAWNQLILALRRAGHEAQLAFQAGLAGESDTVQMMKAILDGRCVLTRNYRDFEELHNLIISAQGHHHGIIVIRRDDKTQRNMAPHDIVRALSNLVVAGAPVANQYITLNQWQ
jgi:Domain of unknown function (DUF5615)